MVFDRARAAAALDANVEVIRDYLQDDDDLIERYQAAVSTLPDDWTAADIRDALTSSSYPGALPTDAFDTSASLVCDHPESDTWESHEAVNEWARGRLQNVPMLAADGSEIPPTTQFNVPLAYVQSAWCVNYHAPEGRLERGVRGQLLTPQDISREGAEGDYRFVDRSLVGHHRYEHEGQLVVERMEALADARDEGALDTTPIVVYDGPLVVSFTSSLDEANRQRYVEIISRIVAASQHLEIPLVGYIAGSNATDLVKMTRLLLPESFGDDRVVPDSRVLTSLMSPWGDHTIPFYCRRDGSVDAIDGAYAGETYAFGEDLLFSYLNVPPGAGLDRIEFPGWLTRTDGPDGYATMYEYTREMVRAEAAIGRGYPEVLQQADSDAVLDHADRQQFYRLVQNWAEEHDIPLEWDAKAHSKERRRR